MRTKSENYIAAWMGQKKFYKRLCRHKRRDYWNNKLSDPKNKTAKIWSHINSVSDRGKRSSVDGIQPVVFQFFLSRNVESAKHLIQATEDPVYSAFLKGSLNRLPNFDEDELLKTIQRLPNKQCASDPIPTWLLKKSSFMSPLLVKSLCLKEFFQSLGNRLRLHRC